MFRRELRSRTCAIGRSAAHIRTTCEVLRCSNMHIPDKLQKADLDKLRGGGSEAISHFIERTQRLHELGLAEGVAEWVKVASAVLPESERAEVMVLLMYGYLFMHYQRPEHVALVRRLH